MKGLGQMVVLETWWPRWSLTLLAVLTGVFCAAIAYLTMKARIEVWTIISIAALFVAVVMTIFLGWSFSDAGKKADAAYLEYLKEVDPGVLRQAAISPDLSKRARELIASYLNEQ